MKWWVGLVAIAYASAREWAAWQMRRTVREIREELRRVTASMGRRPSQ